MPSTSRQSLSDRRMLSTSRTPPSVGLSSATSRPPSAAVPKHMATVEWPVLKAVDDALRDETRPWHVLAEWAEMRTGVGRLKLFTVLTCVLAAYMTTAGRGPVLLGDLIAFVCPAYVTAAAVIRPDSKLLARPAVRRRWLTYWMVYVAALVAQVLVGGLLLRVPYYGLMRCAFLVWCFAPTESNGAALIHATVVRRYMAPRLMGLQQQE